MKKEVLTIEEMIVNEVEKKLGKNVLTDLMNDFLIEALEWEQFDYSDLKPYDKKTWLNNTCHNVYDYIETSIIESDLLNLLNYNYNLLDKLHIYDYNFYSKNIILNEVSNLDNIINKVLYMKFNELLTELDKTLLYKIVELYFFTLKVEPTQTMPKLINDCYISEKNLELITEYISYNYNNEEYQRIYINSTMLGLQLDIDSNEEIPTDIYTYLEMFNVIYND